MELSKLRQFNNTIFPLIALLLLFSCEPNSPFSPPKDVTTSLSLKYLGKIAREDIKSINLIITEDNDTIHNQNYGYTTTLDTLSLTHGSTAQIFVSSLDSLGRDIYRGDTAITIPEQEQITIAVTLSPVDFVGNDKPYFIQTSEDMKNEATVGIVHYDTCRAEDPDADSLIYYSIVHPDGDFLLDSVTGAISWSPTQNHLGTHVLKVVVRDPEGLADTLHWEITVVDYSSNNAPQFTKVDSQMIQNATVDSLFSDTCIANDPDGDPITYFIANSSIEGFSIDSASGAVQWKPTVSQVGFHTISIGVKDTEFLSDTISWTITVVNPTTNSKPQFTKISSEMKTNATAGTVYSDTCIAMDPDGDTLTYFIAGATIDGLTIDPKSGAVEWQPSSAQIGEYTVSVGAKDAELLSDTITWTISVVESTINNKPLFTKTASEMKTNGTVGSVYIDTCIAIDPEGDTLTYFIAGNPIEGFLIESTSGIIAWRPTEAQIGDHVATIETRDASGLSDTIIWSITIVDSVTIPVDPLSKMKLIPSKGRTFTIGDDYGLTNEKPAHPVSFTYDFYMDSTEVTQLQFNSVMSDPIHGYVGYNTPMWNGTYGIGDNYPAYNVSWSDAVLYCNALSKIHQLDTVYKYTSIAGSIGSSYELTGLTIDNTKMGFRLPYEAEWEFACRANTSSIYYWGNDGTDDVINMYAVHYGNSGIYSTSNPDYGTHIVGSKKPNNFGLYDMSGNVNEYCSDWYYQSYLGTALETDPTGPGSGFARVKRGGSWNARKTSYEFTSPWRSETEASEKTTNNGFRVVLRK